MVHAERRGTCQPARRVELGRVSAPQRYDEPSVRPQASDFEPGESQPTGMKSFAISIIRTLREHGHEAYLVGGCVRDLLLNREPADYDVSTSATPDEVMRIFPETYAVGAQFGVVLVPATESALTADTGLRSQVSAEAPRSQDSACSVSSLSLIHI